MKNGLSRRNLFKYMGVGGATAVVAGCEIRGILAGNPGNTTPRISKLASSSWKDT